MRLNSHINRLKKHLYDSVIYTVLFRTNMYDKKIQHN